MGKLNTKDVRIWLGRTLKEANWTEDHLAAAMEESVGKRPDSRTVAKLLDPREPTSTQPQVFAKVIRTLIDAGKTSLKDVRCSPAAGVIPWLNKSNEQAAGASEAVAEVKNCHLKDLAARRRAFVGRQCEREQLRAFAQDDAASLWWLLTGNEGAGKTSLAMAFGSDLQAEGWQVKLWKPSPGDFAAWRPRARTLIVVNDACEHPDEVKQALDDLATTAAEFDHPVRVLLIGTSSTTIRYSDAQQPAWFRTIMGSVLEHDERHVAGAIYSATGAGAGQSLFVGHLSDSEVTAIVAARAGHGSQLPPDATSGNASRAPSGRQLKDLQDRVLGTFTGSTAAIELKLPLYVEIVTDFYNEAQGEANIREASSARLETAMRGRVLQTLARWKVQIENVNRGTEDRARKIVALMCVATLCGHVCVLDWENSKEVAHLLPTRQELHSLPALCRALGVELEGSLILGLRPRLLSYWFVRVIADNQGDLPEQWFNIAPNDFAKLTRWALHHRREGVTNFRARTSPLFIDTPFWRLFLGAAGRYASSFGKLLDIPEWQAQFLGGQMMEAGAFYQAEVEKAVDNALAAGVHAPVLVDLMAGGGHRLTALHKKYPTLRILAIDKDITRIGFNGDDERLVRVRREIDGEVGLSDLLRQHFQTDRCDVIIARKALHEIPWARQRQLIDEMCRTLRPGGRVVLHVDSPEDMSDQGRKDYDAAAHVLTSGAAHSPNKLESLLKSSLDSYGVNSAAVFLNLWIKLKDWANYNSDEVSSRYFSSAGEVQRAFENRDLTPRVRLVGKRTFLFDIHAPRFNESGINALGAIADATGRELRKEDFAVHIKRGDERHQFLRRFTNVHLGFERDSKPTESLASILQAKWETVNFKTLLPKLNWSDEMHGDESLFDVEGALFKCPLHILTFQKD